jgi:hypothetical protein
MKGRRRTLDDLYSVYAYVPSNEHDIAVAGLLSLGGAATAAIGSSILLPSGFFATVASDYLFEPGTEEVIASLEDPFRRAYRHILAYDKLRMHVHKLQSAPALDTVAQQLLFKLHKALDPPPHAPDVDTYINAVYPSVDEFDSDTYEGVATAAFLKILQKMESAIRTGVTTELDAIRKQHVSSGWDKVEEPGTPVFYRSKAYKISTRYLDAKKGEPWDVRTKHKDTTAYDPYPVIRSGILEAAAAAVAAAETMAALRGMKVPPVSNIFKGGRRPLYGGDLREPHSLYSNAGGSDPAPRRGLYAGLQ